MKNTVLEDGALVYRYTTKDVLEHNQYIIDAMYFEEETETEYEEGDFPF